MFRLSMAKNLSQRLFRTRLSRFASRDSLTDELLGSLRSSSEFLVSSNTPQVKDSTRVQVDLETESDTTDPFAPAEISVDVNSVSLGDFDRRALIDGFVDTSLLLRAHADPSDPLLHEEVGSHLDSLQTLLELHEESQQPLDDNDPDAVLLTISEGSMPSSDDTIVLVVPEEDLSVVLQDGSLLSTNEPHPLLQIGEELLVEKSRNEAEAELLSQTIQTTRLTRTHRKDIKSALQYFEFSDFDPSYEDEYDYVLDSRYSQRHEDSYFYLYELIGLNVGLFIFFNSLSKKKKREIVGKLQLSLANVINLRRVWTVITYSFVHYDLLHLLSNLMVLGWSGGRVVRYIGPRPVVALFIGGSALGGVAYLGEKFYSFVQDAVREEREGNWDPNGGKFPESMIQDWCGGCVGASGGCYALLTAHLLLDPHPLTLVAILGYEFIQFWGNLRLKRKGEEKNSGRPRVAHSGHLGGAVWSLIQFRRLIPRLFSSVFWGGYKLPS